MNLKQNERQQLLFRALNAARHESRRRTKDTEWEYKNAEDFLIFAWRHLRTEYMQDWVYQNPQWAPWVPIAPPMVENHALFALKRKRPLQRRVLGPDRWLEEMVASDFEFFSYFAKSSIIEALLEEGIRRFLFNGIVSNMKPHEYEPGLMLRVIVSNSVFEKHFKKVF